MTARFHAHLAIVRIECRRAARRGMPLDWDDARQVALIGLWQADQRAPAGMPDRNFAALATCRVRGALIDELREFHPQARRSRLIRWIRDGAPFGDGTVELARAAGELRAAFAQSGGYEPIEPGPSPEEALAARETWSLVEGEIARLPRRLRGIVRRWLAEEKQSNIARSLRVSEERVCQLIGMAKGQLRARLSDS